MPIITKSKCLKPEITVVIPSYNQAAFLEVALRSVINQSVHTETIVIDGGSTDYSLEIIKRYESHLYWWRSRKDEGQAAAINEGVRKGTAPYVCWLNSDDFFLPGGLQKLKNTLKNCPKASAVYGKCRVVDINGNKKKNYWTAPFSEKHLANRCFIAQPATLIRRNAWEKIGGLDEKLQMSMDYDLWWRLYRIYGKLQYTKNVVAASRWHDTAKTNLYRHAHYCESMKIVHKYYGSVPLKWYIAWPIRVVLWHLRNKAIYYWLKMFTNHPKKVF